MKHNWNHTQSRHERGYGYQWEKLRLSILQKDNYLCQPCAQKNRTTPAREVDHILCKAKGGTDDPDNLQSICTECHKTKTLLEQGKKRKTLIGIDGYPAE